MSNLIKTANTVEILKKHNIHTQKRFGQNFLCDGHVLDKIIKSASISKNDLIIEIGPGIGTMTQSLCEHAGYVIAVEIDKLLIPVLNDTLSSYKNVKIVNEDILKYDIEKEIEIFSGYRPVKIIANLPYYITTPIVMKILESNIDIESLVLMVQKEVAVRMQSSPGSKDYGALSLAVQYYAKPYIAAHVPKNCFIPRPNVSSAVIKLSIYDKPPVETKDKDLMFSVIKASFSKRRKTLSNALRSDEHIFGNNEAIISKNDIETILFEMGLDVNVRGEELTLTQFAEISDRLFDLKVNYDRRRKIYEGSSETGEKSF